MSLKTGAVALLLLIATVYAVENVSSYQSPMYFDAWVNNTQYLYLNTTANNYLMLNATSSNENLTLHARVIVNNSKDDLGWDFVYVAGVGADNATLRRKAYYHAGLAEGWATAERIWQVWLSNNYSVGEQEKGWIKDHIEFMTSQVNNTNNTADPFWIKVGDLFALMEGIADGFQRNSTHALSKHDIFLLNFANEYGDVANHFSTSNSMMRNIRTRQHCSALVKPTKNDIFFSHDTWSNYTTMVRQYKTYAMETIVTMSGFAGMIASGDDWYITNNSMAIQETTNDYYDNELAVKYVLPKTVSEFLRVMVANFITTSGKTWTETFARYNSGTYCNQYMVLDAKHYAQYEPLRDGLFWVAEQMPGNVTMGDQTKVLREQGYWASYNIPFYRNIYVDSGFEKMEKEQGTFWSYSKYARAEIFHRNQSNVSNLDSMRKMMRFNEWQTDPLSTIPNCSYCTPATSPMLSIASRGDLVSDAPGSRLPEDWSYAQFFAKGPFGDIDSKITSANMLKTLTGTVICGPTHESQKPFSFSESGYPKPPGGSDMYDFDWVTFSVPSVTPPPPHGYYPSVAPTWVVIGAILGCIAAAALILLGVVVALRKRNQNSDATYTTI